MGKFADQFGSHLDKAQTRLENTAYNATVLLFSNIVFDTPWDHESGDKAGTARGGWNTSIGENANVSFNGRKDITGYTPVSEIQSTVKSGEINWLANSAPHIVILDYGLFTLDHSRRIINHYSSQATQGMVSVNVRRWNEFVLQAASIAGSK